MDIDENDLLGTNLFIREPNLVNNLSLDENNEFRSFFRQNDNGNGSNSDTVSKRESFDNNNNPVIHQSNNVTSIIHIDSRDRDAIKYPKPNFFDIFLSKTFNNIQKIKLVSIEFPNTNAVINSFNNRIYWINQEDITDDIIDTITGTYPVYNVELRIGSYFADTLGTEMTDKMNAIKRRNGVGSFHYFDITLDNDTDIVTFTSLILTQLVNNPINTVSGTGTIHVTQTNHGFVTGNTVYIIGAKTISGIPSTALNGSFKVTRINNNTFQYEVTTNAGETTSGGGTAVKIGVEAPFQFLFGEKAFTVAQNIGFPLENSSEKINTYIQSITPFYQALITIVGPHQFNSTPDFIGKTCELFFSNTTPSLDGTKVITQIVSYNSFLISTNSLLETESFNNGTVTFNSIVYQISSIVNNPSQAILITTFYDHNYTLVHDLNSFIALSNTSTLPILDGSVQITSILSNTTIIIAGSLFVNGNTSVSIPGTGGEIARFNPLTSFTAKISNIIINSGYTTIISNIRSRVAVGDIIQIYNLISSPDLTVIRCNVININSPTSFDIAEKITQFDPALSNAYFGTGLIDVSFPNHTFNTILSIYNTGANTLAIDTLIPHNLVSGSIIRLSSTNSFPVIDGSYTVTVIDSDTFSISHANILINGTYGVIGISNDFFLYSAISLGGINQTFINNTRFNVREVIDSDTFSFMINGAFATLTENGGGDNLFISSFKHGFLGTQTNTKNKLLNRSINLQGESYSLLCSPQLATIHNTGSVKDIFARISLDQSPNNMVFNFLSSPKIYELSPLAKLENLTLSVYNHDNTLYEFNDLDYSLALEITEIINTSSTFNKSSRYDI
jgi:hypothetical protein